MDMEPSPGSLEIPNETPVVNNANQKYSPSGITLHCSPMIPIREGVIKKGVTYIRRSPRARWA